LKSGALFYNNKINSNFASISTDYEIVYHKPKTFFIFVKKRNIEITSDMYSKFYLFSERLRYNTIIEHGFDSYFHNNYTFLK